MKIIPRPNNIIESSGYFIVNKDTSLYCDEKFAHSAEWLSNLIFKAKGYKLKVNENADISYINDNSLSEEEYTLEISSKNIVICASCDKGAFYATQSLRLLAGLDTIKSGQELLIGKCFIKDKPRFKWRGLMLDESRHFFGKEEVKRLLDLMSINKLNVFHWHLTDDQGWRIEIKKYPKLIEIGSRRKGTQIHGWHRCSPRRDIVWEEYGGHYTQDDIKEIVEYALDRHIDIVPEIDMPAHFAAAMAAYNYLACREVPVEVPYYFGGQFPLINRIKNWNRSACIGKKSTFQFIFDIIDEISELFPFPYFHIGGDEAPKGEWKKCPECTRVIRENSLKDVNQLQAYFNNRINEYLKKKGKRLIGWNEILNASNLDRSIIGQYWTYNRDINAENHINSGGDLIISRHKAFYFDMPYAQVPLQNTYDFDPVHNGIGADSEKNILGVEGALWTEWIRGRNKLDLNLFPRLQALSEVAWTEKVNKDWEDFLQRWESYKTLLRTYNVKYAENEVSIRRKGLGACLDRRRWISFDQQFELLRNNEIKNLLRK